MLESEMHVAWVSLSNAIVKLSKTTMSIIIPYCSESVEINAKELRH